jgi:hypothetical protein
VLPATGPFDRLLAMCSAFPSGRPLRLLTFTTLFPNSQQPNHGVFVENRLRCLVGSGEVESVVFPSALFPVDRSVFPRLGPVCPGRQAGKAVWSPVYHPRFR